MLNFRIHYLNINTRPDKHLVISLKFVITYPKISLTYKIVVRHHISLRDIHDIYFGEFFSFINIIMFCRSRCHSFLQQKQVVSSEWNKGKKTVFFNYLFPTVKWLASFKFQHSLAKIAFNFHVGQDLNCWQSGNNSRVSSWWFDTRLITTVLFVFF